MKVSPVFRIAGLCALLTGGAGAHAQVTQLRPVDVLGGIQNGSIHHTTTPPAGNDSLNPFDGNPNSDRLITGIDSLTVTLEFDSLVQIKSSKVFFLSIGIWSLEVAASLSDLDTKTGSYSLLIDRRPYAYRAWDSLAFPPADVRFVRLRARDTVYSFFDLGEWTLMNAVTFTKLVILPSPPRLIPGGSLKMHVAMTDDHGRVVPYTLGYPLDWSTVNPAVASVDANGVLSGVALGSTTLNVTTEPNYIEGSAPVEVVADFVSPKVSPMTVRVALVLFDPVLQAYGYQRLHVRYGWRDPVVMSNSLVKYFRAATDSVVNFVIDTTLDCSRLFTAFRGGYLTVSNYVKYLDEPGWPTLKAAADSLKFDYRAMVKYYQLDSLRNIGRVDEVWVYAGPYMGMWESQLMGPKAFWWNSTPIRDGTSLTKLLSVMGLNYERGVDQGFHSFGHRLESAMVQAYQDAQGRPWNDTSANPTPWDLFTRIEKDVPGGAHVGNVHFPPNGASGYDYGNTRWVTSYAQNWFRYPYIYTENTQVNVTTWKYKPSEPLAETDEHLGYLWWFYNHMPRYTGVTDGVLNNWWHYFLDYEAAVALAGQTPVLGVRGEPSRLLPQGYGLEQNYPNPFNPETAITFSLPGQEVVTLAVYDILGRRVATLADGKLGAGSHTVNWNARLFASGVYFCRLSTPGFVETRKMVLLK